LSVRVVKQAFLARIRTGETLSRIVYEGTVKDRPNRYVSVFTDSGLHEAERWTGPQSTSTQTFVVHSVGSTPDKAQEVAELVQRQVIDHVLVVEGRTCRRIRHESSQPIQLDQDIDPELYYCVDEFAVTTSPNI
jgi:hypothetical protein